jgi:hypothetical protein
MYRRLGNHQKVNNLPSTGEISRKDLLNKNIARLRQAAPDAYNFVPQGWIIPAETSALKAHGDAMAKTGRRCSYIVKPVNSSMGRGIFLITRPDQLYANAALFSKGESAVVQEYLSDPLLIDGFKFDLRIYVLVTSCDPLRAFTYRDGLVRLGLVNLFFLLFYLVSSCGLRSRTCYRLLQDRISVFTMKVVRWHDPTRVHEHAPRA